ncbi:MAG: hypothetical protein AAFY26_14810 [Cyanobacteria bacterium J06638_22]
MNRNDVSIHPALLSSLKSAPPLIVWEQERMAQQERIESLLLDGLNSGESIEATDSWWDQKRAGLVERN